MSAAGVNEHPLMDDGVVDRVLRATLAADGVELVSWRRTRVHPRGSALSVRLDADVTGADQPTLDVVLHASTRPVPPGAATVEVAGRSVHVWRLPHDPYMPGLPAASSPTRVGQLLSALQVPHDAVALTLRAYRPGRRAVIEVRTSGGSGLYLKVLGGRTPSRVRERAEAMAHVHRTLHAHGVPVPRLIGVAAAQGIVAIAAVPGRTLRAALLLGHEVPPAADVAAITLDLGPVEVATAADPRGFADITRHVPLLREAVPDVAAALEEIAAAVEDVGGPSGTVHGDLHDGQVLIAGGRVSGVLDLDGVGRGLLADDAGRMVAYLEHAATVDGAPTARVDAYRDDLVRAYADGGIPTRALAAGTAAAWVGLATAPFRARPDGWQHEVRDAIERAHGWARSIGD